MKKMIFETQIMNNLKKINKILCDMNMLDSKLEKKMQDNVDTIEEIKKNANDYIENLLEENKDMENMRGKNKDAMHKLSQIVNMED